MKTDQRGLLTEEDEEDSCKITEFFVNKVKSTTHFQHMESRSKAITGLYTAESSVAAERSKNGDGEMVKQRKEPEYCSTSSNPKGKLSLIGIRRRKSGRYSASISDPIRHKEVWLGTFDTAEEASQAYFSKKAEFEKEKLSHGNKEYRSKKNCDPRKTTHIIGVQKRKNSGKYVSAIKNPISKKRVWLGTFGTAEEASQAYQSKKLEFQKLVNAKRQCSSNKQTHSTQDEKPGHENVKCELESAGGSEIDVPSSIGGAEQRIDSHKIGIAEEGFRVYGEKSSDNCDTSCDPKVKRSLIGIQRQKSGRYAALITDPIRHKKVRLGTFDNAEEASQAYFSKKSEFEKLRQQGQKENKPKKKCDQIQQPESPSVMAFLDATASESGRAKRIGSHKTATHLIGAHKSKKTGRYSSMIENPITKKKIWLGTFDTAEEASHAFQSKKLEFQKLVEAKQQQCTNKQRKSEKLVNVKQEHENENCELKSAEIDVPLSNSSIGGTVQSIDSYQSKKFDLQSSKKVELQSKMSTDSSAGEKQEGQEDDKDLWMGEWVQLPGDNRAVMFSLKLGLPIIDNYGSLLGEFSSLDDLSIS